MLPRFFLLKETALDLALVGTRHAVTITRNGDSPSYYSVSEQGKPTVSVQDAAKKMSAKRLAEGLKRRNDFGVKCLRMNSIAEIRGRMGNGASGKSEAG